MKKILRTAGWQFERQAKGDHEVWADAVTGKHVTVDGEILSRHTANGILREAGLPKRF